MTLSGAHWPCGKVPEMKLQRSPASCPMQTLEPPSVRAEVSKLSLGPCRRFDAKTKSAIASVFSVSLCPLCLDATSHQRADLPCSAPSQGFFEHRGHRDTEDTENTMRSQEDNATGVSGLGADTGASAMGSKPSFAKLSLQPLDRGIPRPIPRGDRTRLGAARRSGSFIECR